MAGTKARRFSREGGLLNKMFGTSTSSLAKEDEPAITSPNSSTTPSDHLSAPSPTSTSFDKDVTNGDLRNSLSAGRGRKSTDEGSPVRDSRRRKSSMSKASSLFASAKNSLHLSSSAPISDGPPSSQQTPMQKLGRTDAALNVPQGSLNNSAGESHPTPRSSFLVGVTEDKNKKCRRTMEDTHAYLYNFLGTPAPTFASDATSPTSIKKNVKSGTGAEESNASQVVETDNGYFAVFDGHAGSFAADWCGKKLHLLLEEIIRNNPNSAIPELLDQTFTSVDRQLEKLPLKNSGCTAICAVLRWEDRIPNPLSATGSTSIAPVAAAVVKAHEQASGQPSLTSLLPPAASTIQPPITSSNTIPKLQESASRQRVLYTANVGDARIVLCRNGKALRLSYDHKGSDENEGKRIQNAGGLILNNRVNGVLAVTRALGDAYMKELVTGHPYTTETVIQPDIDEFLILACDGLWDVCTDQEAVDLIRNTKDPQIASKQLVDYALSRFSTDNLSCMVVRFDGLAVKQTVDHKLGLIGVEGDPSHQVGGISEADAIVKEARKSMSEVAVEGSSSDEGGQHLSQDAAAEEVGKESGPALDATSGKHLEVGK